MLFHPASTSSIRRQIDQMDASVAPPKLMISISCRFSRIFPGNPNGIQSPLSRHNRNRPSPAPLSTSICISAGTVFQMVTSSRSSNSAHWAGSRSPSGAGSTTAPPPPAPPPFALLHPRHDYIPPSYHRYIIQILNNINEENVL